MGALIRKAMGENCLRSSFSAEGLSIGHGGQVVAKEMAFELRPGEVAALIGLNGSGKSTLLRTLAGLLRPLSGRLIINGQRSEEITARQYARLVSTVLPGRPRLGIMRVRPLVELGRQPWTGADGGLREEDTRIVDHAMEVTGIQDLAGRVFDSLSDGEAQKVLIARALTQGTPAMLLDEPTAHLDLVNRVAILQMLRTVAVTKGKSVLLSLHDLSAALDLCDRILLLHDGALWSGSPLEAIESGRIAEAFEREGLRFDAPSGALRPLK